MSNRYPKWSLIAILIVVAGCTSFNNNFNTYQPSKPIVITTEKETELDNFRINSLSTNAAPVIDKSTNSGAGVKSCELSPYPPMPPVPELPTRALQAAAGMEAIEQIERKHIADLRAYISETKRIQQKSQLAFYEKCDVVSK